MSEPIGMTMTNTERLRAMIGRRVHSIWITTNRLASILAELEAKDAEIERLKSLLNELAEKEEDRT